jgi:hypothetical protein
LDYVKDEAAGTLKALALAVEVLKRVLRRGRKGLV